MSVRVALVAGPMYDALYSRLAAFTAQTGIAVTVAYRGDHPALNEHLAGLAAAAKCRTTWSPRTPSTRRHSSPFWPPLMHF